MNSLTLEALEKRVLRRLEGGQSPPPPFPSNFDTIHTINIIFGTYNELPW